MWVSRCFSVITLEVCYKAIVFSVTWVLIYNPCFHIVPFMKHRENFKCESEWICQDLFGLLFLKLNGCYVLLPGKISQQCRSVWHSQVALENFKEKSRREKNTFCCNVIFISWLLKRKIRVSLRLHCFIMTKTFNVLNSIIM